MRVERLLRGWLCVSILLLSACAEQTPSGPSAVMWDRDTCERCRMALSSRYYAAQVRYIPQRQGTSKVAFFDDIGCAILWLEDKPWRNDPTTEIWVVDEHSGDWIDARRATFVQDRLTPMEYGLGAHAQVVPDGLSFSQAIQHVKQVEQRFDRDGLQLMHKFREQARQRAEHHKARSAEEELPSIVPEKE